MFSPAVSSRLGHYVYRLIDPRNGETFYVGKGVGNRVFHHADAVTKAMELEPDEDEVSIKMHRVRDILSVGLKVIHVVQRHGMTEKEAFHVEGAMIDAFPGLANIQNGHGNSEFGAMHADAIIRKYEAQPLEVRHRIIFLTITRRFVAERGVYEGCRGIWKLSRGRAEKAELVLPVLEGIVAEVYRPTRWLEGTVANFPIQTSGNTDRFGFEGAVAEPDVAGLYKGKRLPDGMKATQNPVRYTY